MTQIFLDIETIPGQGLYDDFLKDAQENFKAPSSLTKAQACSDLGITGNDAKFTSKDDAIAKWESVFSEQKAPEVANENWKKTSLDGSKGEIWSIAFCMNGEMTVIDRGAYPDFSSEKELLAEFFLLISSVRERFFIGHNITFDLKFLFHRAVINGVRPTCRLPFDGYHDRDYYCTMAAWAGRRDRISLDNLCSALGLSGKGDIDGSKVWQALIDGRHAEVSEYNIDDVQKVLDVFNKLNFMVP
jgi:DNA polymerase elongation subunit (family B)